MSTDNKLTDQQRTELLRHNLRELSYPKEFIIDFEFVCGEPLFDSDPIDTNEPKVKMALELTNLGQRLGEPAPPQWIPRKGEKVMKRDGRWIGCVGTVAGVFADVSECTVEYQGGDVEKVAFASVSLVSAEPAPASPPAQPASGQEPTPQPLPWAVVPSDYDRTLLEVNDSLGHFTGLMVSLEHEPAAGIMGDPASVAANLHHAVQAVNNHARLTAENERLKEALRDIAEHHSQENDGEKLCRDYDGYRLAIYQMSQKARAALGVGK